MVNYKPKGPSYARAYDDIIDMPHHVSKVHPQMSVWDRSAQFSPFAALTGHEAAIAETARFTEEWHEPDEDKKAELDEKISQVIYRHLNESDDISIKVTYFKPDKSKAGGSYEDVTGTISKIDDLKHWIYILADDGMSVRIDIRRISDIEFE